MASVFSGPRFRGTSPLVGDNLPVNLPAGVAAWVAGRAARRAGVHIHIRAPRAHAESNESKVIGEVPTLVPLVPVATGTRIAGAGRRPRKHSPLLDIAAAGGWEGTEALQRCYLHADDETMLAVVMSGAELREVRKA
jgi:hypothetical protein